MIHEDIKKYDMTMKLLEGHDFEDLRFADSSPVEVILPILHQLKFQPTKIGPVAVDATIQTAARPLSRLYREARAVGLLMAF